MYCRMSTEDEVPGMPGMPGGPGRPGGPGVAEAAPVEYYTELET